jgi:hypothetical protein
MRGSEGLELKGLILREVLAAIAKTAGPVEAGFANRAWRIYAWAPVRRARVATAIARLDGSTGLATWRW